jgi:hypothetical protein
MATTSREVARDALVALLDTALIGAGLVKTVSGSKVDSLQGVWPLVTVLSAGSERVIDTFGGGRVKSFSFMVQSWVLMTAAGWTVAQSADRLDAIEAAIAAVYEDNKNTANWELLTLGPTKVWELVDDGEPYWMEEMPTKMELPYN